MDIVGISLALLALAGWLAWLWHLVVRDGLGDRRPPASHEAWDDQRDGLPSVGAGTGR